MYIESSEMSMAWHMLIKRRMTNTEFIVREKGGAHHPLFKATQLHFSLVDGALVLGLLVSFMGLILLLAR